MGLACCSHSCFFLGGGEVFFFFGKKRFQTFLKLFTKKTQGHPKFFLVRRGLKAGIFGYFYLRNFLLLGHHGDPDGFFSTKKV